MSLSGISIDASLVSTILLCVFIGMIVISVIAGIVSFIKGIYKTTLRTILKAVLVVVLIFISPFLANIIGRIDIRSLIGADTPTTILSYICSMITDTGLVSPMNGMSIYETAIAISSSLLSYVTFVIGMILFHIVAWLVSVLIYHGILRWILPVETKKDRKAKKKNKGKAELTAELVDEEGNVVTDHKLPKKLPLCRIPSALIGAVQEFVFVSILLCPLTSFARILVSNGDEIDSALVAAGTSEEDVSKIDSYLDATENSILYNYLGINDIDSSLMSQVSKVKVNGTSISFGGLVESVFDIADPILEKNIVTYDQAAGTVTVNLALLLSAETINSITEVALDDSMVLALIPPVIDFAVNNMAGAAIDLSKLDFSNVDWKNELSVLNTFYSAVYDGTVKSIVTEDNRIDPTHFLIAASSMSDDDIRKYADAAYQLGSLETIRNNGAMILSSIGVYLEGLNLKVLPTDSDSYKDVSFSHDFSIAVSSILRFFRTLGMDISASMKPADVQTQVFSALGDDVKRQEISDILLGTESTEGLLDMDLVDVISLPDIMTSLLASVPSISQYVKGVDLTQVLDLDNAGLKSEISVLLEMGGMVLSEDSRIYIDNFNSIDFSDPETAQQFAALLDCSAESVIFNRIYPSIMKSLLFNTEFAFNDYLFGLTPYNFNYDSDDFIQMFRNVLLILPEVNEMVNLVSDESMSNEQKLENVNTTVLSKLLTIICNSDFFNSDQRTGITSGYQKNVNIHTFFSNLFSMNVFESIGVVVPDLEEMQSYDWETEIDAFCSIIDDIKPLAGLLTRDDVSMNDIEDSTQFASLIKDGFKSKIFAPTILRVIDDSLSQYMEAIGIHISLNEMRNELWIDDSDRIAEIIDILKGMNNGDFSLDNMDPDLLNALLTVLNKTNFLNVGIQQKDKLGYAIYSIVQFSDIGSGVGVSLSDYSLFALSEGDSWSSHTSVIQKDSGEFEITDEGEIKYLCDFISVIKQYGTDSLANGKIPDGFIDSVSGTLDSQMIRKVISRVMSGVADKVSLPNEYKTLISSIDFTLFETMSSAEIQKELKLFEKLTSLSSEQYSGTGKLQYMLNNMFTLSAKKAYPDITDTEDARYSITLLDEFDELMDLMRESRLLTEKKNGTGLSPIAEFMKSALDSLGLTSKATMAEDPDMEESMLNGILSSVSDWEEELGIFKSIIFDIQGLDTTISFDINTISKDQMSAVLLDMNTSAILHRVPISMMKTELEGRDISSLIKDPDSGIVVHELDFNTHLGTSTDDIDYWKNDYSKLLVLMYDQLSSVFGTDVSMDNIDISTVNLDFLYTLGTMNLFRYTRSYLVYNILSKNMKNGVSLSSVLREADAAPYGENKKTWIFEELFYRNEKLCDSTGTLIEEDALNDLSMVKSVINTVIDNVDAIMSTTSLQTLELSFTFDEINADCVQVSSSSFYRSDFASELVAGLENQLFTNADLSDYFSALAGLNLRENDYSLINIIEGRAIDGVMALSKTELSKKTLGVEVSYYAKSSLVPVFTKFGSSSNTYTDETLHDQLDYYLALSDYFSDHNSKIALKIKDIFSYLPVIRNDPTLTFDSYQTLSTLVSFDPINVSFSDLIAGANII